MRKLSVLTVQVLFCFSIAAQQSESLKKNYELNYSRLPQYNLYIIFNQPKYTPGDTVWFNAYFLKEDLTRLAGQYLFEFNLMDNEGVSRLQFQFLIVDGQGNNQFVIPNTLEDGIYLATVYNNYFRNFDNGQLFQKEIAIVRESQIISANFLNADVTGGNLIDSVSTKLTITTDAVGPDSILLVTGKGRVIRKIWVNGPTTETITFIPRLNTSYQITSTRNNIAQIKLPSVSENGCNIHLNHSSPEKMVLCADYNFNNTSENKYTIALTQGGKTLYIKSFEFNGLDSIQLEFFRKDLPNGLVQCQAIDKNGIVVSHQTIYNQQSDINVEVKSGPIATEGNVLIDFYLRDKSGEPLSGEFSVSIINKNIFDGNSTSDFFDRNYSSVRSQISIDQTRQKNYFLSQPIANNYLLFGSVEKSGKARYLTGEYLETGTQILIYLQKSKYYLHTTIGQNGLVRFALPDLYHPDEIYYTAFDHTRNREIRAFEILWDNTNIILSAAPESLDLKSEETYVTYSDKVRRINQSYAIFKYDSAFDVNDWVKTQSDFAQLIKKPDAIIRPNDYIPFPTLSEFIQEVVKTMYYRKRKRGDRVRVYLEDPMRANSDPVYIIDDMATRNSNFFLSLAPNDIMTIEILNSKLKLKPLGLLGRNGVVIVNTQSGNIRAETLNVANIVPGLSKPLQFKIPTSITPQFRSTVYWNPSVQVDANGKAVIRFPFTDDATEYSVIVNGITSDGRFFTSQSTIKPVIK